MLLASHGSSHLSASRIARLVGPAPLVDITNQQEALPPACLEKAMNLRGGSTQRAMWCWSGCGVPKRGMGWYHAKQMLDGASLPPRSRVVEPWFLGVGAGFGEASRRSRTRRRRRTAPSSARTCRTSSRPDRVAPLIARPLTSVTTPRRLQAPFSRRAAAAAAVPASSEASHRRSQSLAGAVHPQGPTIALISGRTADNPRCSRRSSRRAARTSTSRSRARRRSRSSRRWSRTPSPRACPCTWATTRT